MDKLKSAPIYQDDEDETRVDISGRTCSQTQPRKLSEKENEAARKAEPIIGPESNWWSTERTHVSLFVWKNGPKAVITIYLWLLCMCGLGGLLHPRNIFTYKVGDVFNIYFTSCMSIRERELLHFQAPPLHTSTCKMVQKNHLKQKDAAGHFKDLLPRWANTTSVTLKRCDLNCARSSR